MANLRPKHDHAHPKQTKRTINTSRSRTAIKGSLGGDRKEPIRIRKLAVPSQASTSGIANRTAAIHAATADRMTGLRLLQFKLDVIQAKRCASPSRCCHWPASLLLVEESSEPGPSSKVTTLGLVLIRTSGFSFWKRARRVSIGHCLTA